MWHYASYTSRFVNSKFRSKPRKAQRVLFIDPFPGIAVDRVCHLFDMLLSIFLPRIARMCANFRVQGI
jgi:hypothetical protein